MDQPEARCSSNAASNASISTGSAELHRGLCTSCHHWHCTRRSAKVSGTCQVLGRATKSGWVVHTATPTRLASSVKSGSPCFSSVFLLPPIALHLPGSSEASLASPSWAEALRSCRRLTPTPKLEGHPARGMTSSTRIPGFGNGDISAESNRNGTSSKLPAFYKHLPARF